MEKRDFSQNCDKNDENLNNPCWKCNRFLFPIGCMVGEDDMKKRKYVWDKICSLNEGECTILPLDGGIKGPDSSNIIKRCKNES